MPQQQGQYQVQSEAQLQRLSPLQLMTTRLLELSVLELEQRVKDESIVNFALETGDCGEADTFDGNDEPVADSADEVGDGSVDEMEERMAFMEEYLDNDDLPAFQQRFDNDRQERPLGETVTFVDDLMNQLVDFDLNDHQRELVEYLIGSLNDNGYLDTPLPRIADEMMFHHNIETDEMELEQALGILQQFDPPGIGARDTRECLLLQIDRKMNDKDHLLGDKYFLLEDGRRMIADHYDLFVNNNVEKLKTVLNVSTARLRLIFDELKKLNLHPGLSLTESAKDRVQTAIPDFIVETDLNGEINVQLNRGDLPKLRVSQEYVKQLKTYETTQRKLTRDEQEFVAYTRPKVDAARLFIEAIRQRQETLLRTMNAIVLMQRPFFLSQDPNDLKPLILKDVAKQAGYDISTVSRVRNSKYCLLDGRMYPLSYFFKHPRSNAKGESVDAAKAHDAISRLVAAEDKAHPLSDQQLSSLLAKMGINIKRRTVAKYRDEIGIPPMQHRLSI